MGKRLPYTPNSKIRAILRQLWLRSRERAAALKKTKYCCKECGIKQSVAKGKEVYLEVHHDPPIDWGTLIADIRKALLDVPQYPLCKKCHKEKHETNKKTLFKHNS